MQEGSVIMKLTDVKKGEVVKIITIPNEEIRSQAIRFGLAVGELIVCEEFIPMGPVIVRKNRQEIAIGHGLAKEITVQKVS